jgi:hypothetical protein
VFIEEKQVKGGNGKMKKKTIFLVLSLCFLLIAVANSYAGTVSYWNFNEGSGTVAYDSIGLNNGTISGASWTTGIFGGALSFDGANDAVTVADDSSQTGMSQLTIEAWIKPFGFSSNHWMTIVNKWGNGGPADDSYGLKLFDGKIWFGARGQDPYASNNFSVMSAQSLGVNNWYYIVGVYDGTSGSIYVNGSLDNTVSANSFTVYDTGEPLYIGRGEDYQGWPQYFSGIIDDVKIHSHALTVSELSANYNAAPVPEPTTMLLFAAGLAGLAGFRKRFRKR